MPYISPPGIKIESIDEARSTSIIISCYRETHRLERVLRTFNKALALARNDGNDDEFTKRIVKLHDHKGNLTAIWKLSDLGYPPEKHFMKYVSDAWINECENGWDMEHIYIP